MNTYLISYDLTANAANREAVEKDIESLGKCKKFLTTTYLVVCGDTIEDVQAKAIKHLNNKTDRMLICHVQYPIRGWLDNDQIGWLNQTLFR